MAKTVLKTMEKSPIFVFLYKIIYYIINYLFYLLNVALYIIIFPFSPTLLIFVNCVYLEITENLFTFVKLKL